MVALEGTLRTQSTVEENLRHCTVEQLRETLDSCLLVNSGATELLSELLDSNLGRTRIDGYTGVLENVECDYRQKFIPVLQKVIQILEFKHVL